MKVVIASHGLRRRTLMAEYRSRNKFESIDLPPTTPVTSTSGKRHTVAVSELSIGLGEAPAGIEWSRRLERLRASAPRLGFAYTSTQLATLTAGSFRLEGIDTTDAQVHDALRFTSFKHLRSRTQLRIRNHVAILHRIERMLRLHESLELDHVLEWYAALSSGLCSAMLAGPKIARIEQLIARTNCPHPRLTLALSEVAELHHAALSDALVPGFAGIVARLILQYHMGRCGLLPVLLDAPDRALLENYEDLRSLLISRAQRTYGTTHVG